MDPVSLIVAALTAGAVAAATDVTTQAIKDAYTGLKSIILTKFGQKPAVQSAVEQLEQDPESKGYAMVAQEQLQKAGAGQDQEIVAKAQTLSDLLKQAGLSGGGVYTAHLSGSGAIAQGTGAVAAGAGGIAVGGNVHGGISSGSPAKPNEPNS